MRSKGVDVNADPARSATASGFRQMSRLASIGITPTYTDPATSRSKDALREP